MKVIDQIRRNIIIAIYQYDLQALHALMMDFIAYFERELSENRSMDIPYANKVLEAYQNHDYLRLADLFEYEMNT